MSIAYQITPTGDIDGTTVVDVTNFTVDGQGVRQVAVTGNAGRIPINNIPGIEISDAWVQVARITANDPVAAVPRYALRTSESAEQDIPIASPDLEQPWNVLAPQNSDLIFELTVAADLTGFIYFSIWPVNSENWAKLNCCHVFAPLPTPPPE